MTDLHSLVLESFHVEQDAKFGSFAGYRMPMQYSLGVKGEHIHTRDAVGLFDVSHMGQLLSRGPERQRLLNNWYPQRFKK